MSTYEAVNRRAAETGEWPDDRAEYMEYIIAHTANTAAAAIQNTEGATVQTTTETAV